MLGSREENRTGVTSSDAVSQPADVHAEHGSEHVWFAEHMEVVGWVVFSLGSTLCAGLSAVTCCQITGSNQLEQPCTQLCLRPWLRRAMNWE